MKKEIINLQETQYMPLQTKEAVLVYVAELT